MEAVVSASTACLPFALKPITAAAITRHLGTIGLYGLMANMIVLRSREFGLRIAFGADSKRIARWVATHGLALSVGGIAGGACCMP